MSYTARRRLPFVIIIAALALVCAKPARAGAGHAPLGIAISFTDDGYFDDSIPHLRFNNEDTGYEQRFHVILTNTSARPLLLPKETSAAGIAALTFRITDATKKTWTARRLDKPAREDAAVKFWTLLPGESLVLDVFFDRRAEWGYAFWLPPHNPTGAVILQALYHCPAAPGTPGAWSGESASAPVQCIIK